MAQHRTKRYELFTVGSLVSVVVIVACSDDASSGENQGALQDDSNTLQDDSDKGAPGADTTASEAADGDLESDEGTDSSSVDSMNLGSVGDEGTAEDDDESGTGAEQSSESRGSDGASDSEDASDTGGEPSDEALREDAPGQGDDGEPGSEGGTDDVCQDGTGNCEGMACSALSPDACASNGCDDVTARRLPSGDREVVGCVSLDQSCGEAITCGVDASGICWEFSDTCLPDSFEALSCDDERCCSEGDCSDSCDMDEACAETLCDSPPFEQVEWGLDGGNSPLYGPRESRLSADGSFSIVVRSQGGAPDLSCEPVLPTCGDPDLDLDDIALAIAHPDVQRALVSDEEPRVYGLDPRPYDGTLLRVSIDGNVLDIGSTCEPDDAFCNPGLTPGLVALRETLEAVTSQQVADAVCDGVRDL